MENLTKLVKTNKTIAIVCLVSLTLIIGGVSFALLKQGKELLSISGDFALGDYSAFGNLSKGDTCTGKEGYSDIHSSAQVVLKDGAGTILSISRLGKGYADGIGNCMFSVSFEKVPRVEFYSFEVSSRGELKYSYEDLESNSFAVELTLGEVEENIVNARTLEQSESESSNSEALSSSALLPSRDEALVAIRTNAEEEWEDDYEMVRFEIDNQTEAYDWLASVEIEHPDILLRALNEWEDDYQMVQFAYKNQVEAFKSLDNN